MRKESYLTRKSKIVITTLVFLLVIILGILDYLIGPDFSSLLAYLIPVIYVTRFVGRSAGIFISVTSATIWVLADVLADPDYTFVAANFWNHIEKLIIFLIIVFILIKLAKIEEQRKNMVAMLAHDMKNPALVAKGFSQRLLNGKKGPLTAPQEDYIKLITNELSRLERLTLDFLEISRLESDKFKLNPEPLNIADSIKKNIEAVTGEADKKNITMSLDYAESEVDQVSGDAVQIDRVIRNLLGNAINYTDEGGAVTVKILKKKKCLLVQVIDNGRGIPKEHIKQIFTPFHRVKHDQEGTGLGLPIVKTIIKAHDGKIWVESTPGKGSIFSFTLPVLREDSPK
jgi:two-component system, OmpR family, phosphate regulon sensor histidine kinase PhoR